MWTRRRNADDVPPCQPHRPARRGSNASHLARTSILLELKCLVQPSSWPSVRGQVSLQPHDDMYVSVGVGQMAGRLRTGVADRARCCCPAHGACLCRLCCRSADCPSTSRSTLGRLSSLGSLRTRRGVRNDQRVRGGRGGRANSPASPRGAAETLIVHGLEGS